MVAFGKATSGSITSEASRPSPTLTGGPCMITRKTDKVSYGILEVMENSLKPRSGRKKATGGAEMTEMDTALILAAWRTARDLGGVSPVLGMFTALLTDYASHNPAPYSL